MTDSNTPLPSLQEIYDDHRPYRMHRWHHYIPIYERHFARFRDRPIRILEIGVQYGGGLWMWSQYFHPESKIFGLDISPHCEYPKLPNVQVFIGDQADIKVLTGCGKTPDEPQYLAVTAALRTLRVVLNLPFSAAC